ncbi:hypothetical protein ACVIWV_004790 [Bradyrhizobium diazoefficiens]
MRSMIALVSVLLFLTFAISVSFAWLSYDSYKRSVPKPHIVGPLTAIRASMRTVHLPYEPALSEACLMYLKRFRIAAMVAAMASILMVAFVVAVRALDLQRHLD